MLLNQCNSYFEGEVADTLQVLRVAVREDGLRQAGRRQNSADTAIDLCVD